jgi:hypothetical protein
MPEAWSRIKQLAASFARAGKYPSRKMPEPRDMDVMRPTIVAAIENEWDAIRLADELERQHGIAHARVLMIARTELAADFNEAALTMMREGQCRPEEVNEATRRAHQLYAPPSPPRGS